LLLQARFLAYNIYQKPFGGRALPEPVGGHQTPLPQNRGPTSKGRGREGKEGDRMGWEGEERRGKERTRKEGRERKVGERRERKGGRGKGEGPLTQIPGSAHDCRRQMNLLRFGRRDKGAGYDRKFESTNRCCHVANDFTNFAGLASPLHMQRRRHHITIDGVTGHNIKLQTCVTTSTNHAALTVTT